jgi:hypothetical protein
MERIALLLIVLAAACGGGTESGPATLTGVMPAPKSAGARIFEGADGEGNTVMGWKIEFFEQAPGADCLSEDTKVVAAIGIYTRQAASTTSHPLLDKGTTIPIVTQSPPVVNGSAAANMSAMGVTIQSGALTLTDFHLTDPMHADRLTGTVSAGGTDGTGNSVAVTGDFDVPYCPEED